MKKTLTAAVAVVCAIQLVTFQAAAAPGSADLAAHTIALSSGVPDAAGGGEAIHDKVLRHVHTSDRGVFFDQAEAIRAGEPPEVIVAGRLVNGLAASHGQYGGADIQYGADYDLREIYRYGNWCGLRHGAGEPIDALDAACMQHDSCYSETNFDNCGCDADLRNGALGAQPSLMDWGRLNAEAIVAWTSLKPCV